MIVLGSCAMSLIELHRRNLRRRKQKSIQKRKLLSENSSSHLNNPEPHQMPTFIGADGASGGSGSGGAIPPLLQQLVSASNMSSKDPNSSSHHSGAELVLPGELERKESFEELNDDNVSTKRFPAILQGLKWGLDKNVHLYSTVFFWDACCVF